MKTDNTQALLERLSSIPELDCKSALERLDNQGEIYISSLRVLMDKLPSLLEKMEQALKEGDMRSFGITAHGLKSSCYGIGANTLGDEALELEKAGKAGDAPFCAAHFSPWEQKMKAFYGQTDAIFRETDEPKTYSGAGDKAAMLPRLEDAGKMLDAYQCDEAVELLEEISQMDYGAELNAQLERIIRLCNAFSYDDARAIITGFTGGS